VWYKKNESSHSKNRKVLGVDGEKYDGELKYGFGNVLVVCRSNKRANGFNKQIRFKIKWQENDIYC
jgi:hypothetical protein